MDVQAASNNRLKIQKNLQICANLSNRFYTMLWINHPGEIADFDPDASGADIGISPKSASISTFRNRQT
jgi:hypothetical protein